MNTKNKKRNRGENWSEDDKFLLKELVQDKYEIIENKVTDTKTNSIKQEAWLDLQKSFNNMCSGSSRTLAQLKSQWTLLKIMEKRKLSSENNTEDDPLPPTSVPDPGNVADWVAVDFVEDNNGFESDYQITKRTKRKSNQTDETSAVEFEKRCRMELHAIQMENERKRGELLDLEKVLVLAKIKKATET